MYLGEMIALVGLGFFGVCLGSFVLNAVGRFLKKLIRAIAFTYLDEYNEYHRKWGY